MVCEAGNENTISYLVVKGNINRNRQGKGPEIKEVFNPLISLLLFSLLFKL
jgi:hypothetical protein